MAEKYFERKDSGAITQTSMTGIIDQHKRNPEPIELSSCIEYLYSFILEYKSSLDDEAQPITDGFMSLRILSRYDRDKFPVVMLKVMVSELLLKNIQDDYRKASVRITMLRYYQLEQGKYSDAEELWSKKEFMIADIGAGNLPADFNNNAPEVEDKLRGGIPITLTLIEKDTLAIMKDINSLIFNKCKMSDALAFLVGKYASKTKVSIQIPDNTDEYEQVYIPPVDIFSVIAYLDDYYGLYSYGHVAFCDLGELIILSKTDPNVEKDADITELDVNLFQGEKQFSPGSRGSTYVDKENKKLTIFYGTIPVARINDVANKLLCGKDITIGSRDSSFTPEGGAGIEADKLFDKQSYFWLDSSSKFADKNIEELVSERSEVVQLRIAGTLYEYFCPKMLVNIRATYEVAEDYKGKYRISKTYTEFLRANGDVELRTTDSNTSNKVLNGTLTSEFTTVELLKIK